MKFSLVGLVAAPFTPFTLDGEVAFEVIPRLARALAENGVTGAFVCGTTGEGASLTSDERRRIVEQWVRAKPPGLKLIVHVGHLSQRESCDLARHAQASGADAIATLAPSFFRPAGVMDLIGWCAPIAAAAPQLPFYYYHMPSMTGVTIPVSQFLAHTNGQIPTLAGVKFTHEDLEDFRVARAIAANRYDVLFGRDEILLSALELGATGAVGSTYNYAAPLYLDIMRVRAEGRPSLAQRQQARAQAFIDVMTRAGGLAAGKATMKLIGLDCGPTRSPLRALTPSQEADLRRDLEAVGFFEFASRV